MEKSGSKPVSPNRSTAPKRGAEIFKPTKVKVLLVTFRFNDLDLEDETEDLRRCFESLGYDVDEHNIRSLPGLKEKLENFLYEPPPSTSLHIIYYHGHGGIIDQNKLRLASHNIPNNVSELGVELFNLSKNISDVWQGNMNADNVRSQIRTALDKSCFQPIAKVRWEDIHPTIMDAETHTIIILDCCEAGLAAATSQEDEALNRSQSKWRKELIGACGWGMSTQNHMSKAMRETLEGLPNVGHDMSTYTLVRRMNHSLVKSFSGDDTVPQAVHYLLRRSQVQKVRLPRLPRRTNQAG